MKVKLSALFASLGLLASCAGDPDVDLGSGPIEQQGNSLVAFSGSWDGYAEGFSFGDGTDRVRLTIDADGNGSIQVGDSDPAAVPAATSGYGDVSQTTLNPGFLYPIAGANVESKRLRASTDPLSYFAAYCAQLTPYEVGQQFTQSGFSCQRGAGGYAFGEGVCTITLGPDGRPATTLDPQQFTTEPIDCGLATCDRYCKCDAGGCSALTNGAGTSFDGALEDNGSKLVGTLVLAGGGTRLTVRLTRD